MNRISQDKIDYLIAHHSTQTNKELCASLGLAKCTVNRNLKKLGLKAKKRCQYKPLTAKEISYLKKHLPTKSIKQIATALGRGITKIGKEAHHLGLTEIINQKKQDSYFKKGNISYTTGKKQTDYMSAEAIERCKVGRFKKGNLPHNTLPDYSEVQRADKSGKIYTLIKVPGNRRQVLKQRYLYEKHIQKIPPRHNVTFIDGNTQNFELNNLQLISNQDLMSKNSLHNYPKELKEIMYLKTSLKRQINKKITQKN